MLDDEQLRPGPASFTGSAPINEEVDWDKSQVIMSETDKFGTITNVNETFVNVSGYSATELIGQPHSIIRHPDMPRIVFKILWANLERGNNFVGIVKNKSKSGKYYWVVTDFEIIKDEFGNIHRYIARRKSVNEDTIKNHIEPLYESLLKLEKVGGMELSNRYFRGFLEKQNKNYLQYVMDILGDNKHQVAKSADFQMDNSEPASQESTESATKIFSVEAEDETKRKSFFSRLFS